MDSEITQKHPNYILIWIYLALLTGVELAVALLHFLPRNILIGSLIFLAVWKALLVALFFMHLKFEPKKLAIMAAAPLPLALILVLSLLHERFK